MKKKWFNAGSLVGLCLAVTVPAHMAHAGETPLIKSTTSFFNETEVFRAESNLLINNTQELDTALLNLENALSVPHNVATALKQLDSTLTLIKQMIVVAKQVPQTRDKAQSLEKNVDSIKDPVAKAAVKAAEVDRAVEPVRNAASKATTAAENALNYETGFRAVALNYTDQIEKLVQCANTKPAIEGQTIKILDGSTSTFLKIDQGIKPVNQTYASTVAAPEKALKATSSKISEEVKKLEDILKSVNGLQGQLQPLNDKLADLKKVLDQSVGFSFDYPCGTKMCSQSTPYPCGVKTCGSGWTSYPCGTKTCYEEVPFPCGVKTCSQGVSMSVSTVINGSDAIQHKIESLLSSTAWEALKAIGVKQYVEELQKKANSLTNPILSQLHLDIPTNLPNLDVSLDAASLANASQQLTQLYDPLTQLGKKIDMTNPVFAPQISSLKSFEKDIASLFKTSGCQAPATKPAPGLPKRMFWKKVGAL